MKIKDLITIVYDVEVFRNCFTCAIYNTETKELKVFEISERNNDLSEIVKLFTNTNLQSYCSLLQTNITGLHVSRITMHH